MFETKHGVLVYCVTVRWEWGIQASLGKYVPVTIHFTFHLTNDNNTDFDWSQTTVDLVETFYSCYCLFFLFHVCALLNKDALVTITAAWMQEGRESALRCLSCFLCFCIVLWACSVLRKKHRERGVQFPRRWEYKALHCSRCVMQ